MELNPGAGHECGLCYPGTCPQETIIAKREQPISKRSCLSSLQDLHSGVERAVAHSWPKLEMRGCGIARTPTCAPKFSEDLNFLSA